MKKTYLIIVAVLFNVAMINAQNKINNKIDFKNYAWNLDNNNRNNSQADFVVPNNDPCFMDSVPSLFIYGGGYYAETQKAQLFYLDPATYTNATIDSVKAFVYTTANYNPTTNIYATIYAFDTVLGDVGAVLGVSNPLTMADAYNNYPYADFAFSTPVTVPANSQVMVSVSVPDYAAGDTLVMFSSNPALNCTQSYLNAWEEYQSAWYPIALSWGNMSDPTQGPNCDWFIFPKVSWGNGMATYIGYDENENINFYPNPTDGLLMIENAKQQVVNIYSAMGTLISSEKIDNNNYKLDLSSFAKGNYMLVTYNNGIVSGKQMIVRE